MLTFEDSGGMMYEGSCSSSGILQLCQERQKLSSMYKVSYCHQCVSGFQYKKTLELPNILQSTYRAVRTIQKEKLVARTLYNQESHVPDSTPALTAKASTQAAFMPLPLSGALCCSAAPQQPVR